jgi:hypothetical protein
MALVDDHGRIFGRFNLIDGLIGLVVLALIPLAYGAFLLFRPNPPKVASIEPNRIEEHKKATLHVTGTDLRPFLLAKIGDRVTGFLVESPTRGEINVPDDMPAGTYDVMLLDRGQPLVRVASALTVVAPPPPAKPPEPDPSTMIDVQVLGRFIGLGRGAADALKRGAELRLASAAADRPPIARVLALQAPQPEVQRIRTGQNRFVTVPSTRNYQVAAVMRLRCAVVNAECKVGETPVGENASLALIAQTGDEVQKTSGESGPAAAPAAVSFVVEDVRPADAPQTLPPASRNAWANVRVRFNATPELIARLHPGDADVPGLQAFDSGSRAVLTTIGTDRRPVTFTSTFGSFQLQDEMVRFTATVRVPVTFVPASATTSSSWTYKGQVVRTGAPFTFETLNGQLAGWVVDMQVGQEPAQ